MLLRRRARRRLVGAIAIALAAVLILPMLFDPEPRPLGPDVDIRIPAPSTPFEVAPGASGLSPLLVEDEPVARAAEPTLPTSAASGASPAEPTVDEQRPDSAALRTAKKPEEKAPAEKETVKAAEKPEVKPVPLPKPSGAFASHGFYLQLGAFTSESNARQLREKVEAAGFKVGVADSNGQYRVRVGPIQEKERAQEVQARLKAKGFTSVMLGP